MTFFYYFCLFLFLALSAILCLTILVQESKSMGLGASFGGDAGDSLFGASTAEVLKKFTAWLIAIFMTFCLLLSLWTTALGKKQEKNDLNKSQWQQVPQQNS
ncbi:MAG: secG [Chlamydiales bacterium]|jgi:preprotein translocase subunit SecG|nr:secG [Chlamydiales bacterium]